MIITVFIIHFIPYSSLVDCVLRLVLIAIGLPAQADTAGGGRAGFEVKSI